MPLHVRTASVSALQARAPAGNAWLSPSEQVRLAGLAAPHRRAQFIAGRLLARHLIAEVRGGTLSDWSVEGSEGRAPIVAGHGDLCLSIAHSGDAVVCALGNVPLGVDIEVCTDRSRGSLLEAITKPEELAGLCGIADNTLPQLVWTLKEAWIKCSGVELFGTMLGHGAQAWPAQRAAANACTWQQQSAVVALVVHGQLPEVYHDAGAPGQLRYWRVGPRG